MKGNKKVKFGCIIVFICLLLGAAFVEAYGIVSAVSQKSINQEASIIIFRLFVYY